MPSISPAFVQVNPNFTAPGVILPYVQASGAFATIYGGKPQVQLSEGDLFVYLNRIDLRNEVAGGQAAYNLLPSVSTMLSQISTPTYMLRVRAEYDHHDTAAMARWGLSIVEAQRLGMHQGHFQMARNALLYGFNPSLGEGLINTQGATALNLPPDTNGNDTVQTYDNGQMALFLLGQIAAMKTRTNQLGLGKVFTILGPQRTLGSFEYNIVQLTQFQREGGGTNSTAGTFKDVLMQNGDRIEWVYDDTLIGKGSGGHDLVIITMPEVTKPMGSVLNTNIFATLAPGIDACTLMYSDRAGPIEITTPIAGGAVDVLSEWRITSGWGIRGEAVTLISMEY